MITRLPSRFAGILAPGLLALGLLVSLGSIAVAPASAEAAALKRGESFFTIDGRRVRVEQIRPRDSAARPPVMVLHGASGIGRGYFVYPYAETFARAGLAAFVVHYYDGLPRGTRNKASVRIYERRERILRAAITHILKRSDTTSDKIGVYGLSLGGFHALSLGATDRRVGAVVNLAGGLSTHIDRGRLTNFPPTLLLHGSRDGVVPIRRSLEVVQVLQDHGRNVSMTIYPNARHELRGQDRQHSMQQAADFLRRALTATDLDVQTASH